MSQQNWSLVIKPRRKWFEIDFKGLWQYRDLIVLFVKRDLVSKYKQTILGPLWFIINPLLSSFLFTVVFHGMAKIKTPGTDPTLFYLCGITAWNYFAACLNGTSNTFVANAAIFGKVYFPRLATPISIVISTLLQFFIQFALLLAMMFIFYLFKGVPFQINIYALWIPYLVILMALMGLGFGIIISALTTKYRDLVNLMTFAVHLWMYGSCVIISLSEVPEKYQTIIRLNPVTSIIETFKYGLLNSGTFDMGLLMYSTVFTIVTLFIGILIFNKVEQGFMDTV